MQNPQNQCTIVRFLRTLMQAAHVQATPLNKRDNTSVNLATTVKRQQLPDRLDLQEPKTLTAREVRNPHSSNRE